LAALACAVLLGCTSDPAPEPAPDDAAARIGNDTQVLQDAQEAVNEVVRNAPDCEAAKASLVEANAKIEDAAARVQTAAGRTTLDAMRKQVARVGELCP
jgi:hypothetical protein